MNDSDRYASRFNRFLKRNQPKPNDEELPMSDDNEEIEVPVLEDETAELPPATYARLIYASQTTPRIRTISPRLFPPELFSTDLLKNAVETPTEPDKPTMDASELTFTVVVDETIKGSGHAAFDPETKIVTCYVPPHVTITNVNMELVAAYYDQKQMTHFSTLSFPPGVFEIEENHDIKPCCKFYSPSKDEVDKGAAQIKGYPFSKPRKYSSCSNIEITGAKHVYVPCRYPMNNSECKQFELADWEEVAVAYEGDTPKVALERRLYANSMPSFRVKQSDGTVVLDSTPTFSEARLAFENVVETNNYEIVRSEEAKKSYFKAVLTTNA